MPNTLRLPDGSYMRHPDVRRIIEFLFVTRCVEIMGFSNLGKSALLRLLSQRDVWTQELGEASREFLPIYIDCNRMLEMTDQGFYELVLRCLQESSPELAALPELLSAYESLVNPASEFQIPLSFNRGLEAALESTQQRVVLLFDEFDEPFERIPSRVFLNLRAKKDRYPRRLAYVTATYRPLTSLRPEDHCSEFCELFAHHTWRLAPLIYSDVERFVLLFAENNDLEFSDADVEFVYQWAGGHPGMMAGVCELLAQELTRKSGLRQERQMDFRRQARENDLSRQGPWSQEQWRQVHRRVAVHLNANETLLSESRKIWRLCSDEERQTLIALFRHDQEPDPVTLERLFHRHLLLQVEGNPRVFSRLFAEHIMRQSRLVHADPTRLWVDVESGQVVVDGSPVDTLTNLEFRLIVLLFENSEKIVDKYSIVTSVWGEGYIDDVDDARIEKLISRLRQKVEPNPSAPRFITTVRGRGYRLVLEPEE